MRPDGHYPGDEPAQPHTPAAPADAYAASTTASTEPTAVPVANEPDSEAATVDAHPEPETLTQIGVYVADDPGGPESPLEPPAAPQAPAVNSLTHPNPADEPASVFARPAPYPLPSALDNSLDDPPEPDNEPEPSDPALYGSRQSYPWPDAIPPWAEEILGEGAFSEPAEADPPPIWPQFRELVESNVDGHLQAGVLRAGWLALHGRIGEEA